MVVASMTERRKGSDQVGEKTKPEHEQKSFYQVGAELAGERSVLVQSDCQRARLLVRTCKEIAHVRK